MFYRVESKVEVNDVVSVRVSIYILLFKATAANIGTSRRPTCVSDVDGIEPVIGVNILARISRLHLVARSSLVPAI